MARLVWLVTGSTSGIGLDLVHHVAARGDIVLATGRSATTRLAHLRSESIIPFDLDVTAPIGTIRFQISEAVSYAGRIDVLFNNAGVARPCTIEEASDEFVARLFEVNVFGPMKVTQAVLPHMRAAGGGRIGFSGTGFSWAPMPFTVHYAAAKAALSTFVEGLYKEVGSFGIFPVVFELGSFEVSKNRSTTTSDEESTVPPKVAEYLPLFNSVMGGLMREVWPNSPNDASKLSNLLIKVVRGELTAQGGSWPVRVAVGADSLSLMRQKCNEQSDLLNEWEAVSLEVMKDGGSKEPASFLMETCSLQNVKKYA